MGCGDALTIGTGSPHHSAARISFIASLRWAGSSRSMKSTPSRWSVSCCTQRAESAGLEVLKPARPRDPEFLDRLRQIGPDCCAVTAYGALIPQAALDIPARGWVNLHFSLLPAWRGAAPVQHAIMHGDDITGATTFLIVPELDAGPVFGVVTEPVLPSDTAGDLLARLAVRLDVTELHRLGAGSHDHPGAAEPQLARVKPGAGPIRGELVRCDARQRP